MIGRDIYVDNSDEKHDPSVGCSVEVESIQTAPGYMCTEPRFSNEFGSQGQIVEHERLSPEILTQLLYRPTTPVLMEKQGRGGHTETESNLSLRPLEQRTPISIAQRKASINSQSNPVEV
jgi:hypothetical protein